MKRISLYFFILFLVSCGQRPGTPNYSTAVAGSEFTVSSSFNSSEIEAARRVCMAFRSKRVLFSLLTNKKYMTTSLKQRDCGRSPASEYNSSLEVKKLLDSGPIYLDGNVPVTYFSVMQTDRDGEFKDLCQDILDDRTPKKIISIGTQKKMYEILRSSEFGGIDVLRIVKGPEVDGVIKSSEIIEFKVTTSDPAFTSGVVRKIERVKTCSDGQGNSEFVQLVTDESGI